MKNKLILMFAVIAFYRFIMSGMEYHSGYILAVVSFYISMAYLMEFYKRK